MSRKRKVHNLYIDGSHNPVTGEIGMGLYDSFTKYSESKVALGDNSTIAEMSALYMAFEYAKKKNIIDKSRIFTDCTHVYDHFSDKARELGFLDLIWIPRELNKDADKLAGEYRKQTESTKVELKCKQDEIVTTTYIKKQSTITKLSTSKMITSIKQYPIKARFALLKKLSKISLKNELIYNEFMDIDKNGFNQPNSFVNFILLVIPKEYMNKSFANKYSDRRQIPDREGFQSMFERLKKLS